MNHIFLLRLQFNRSANPLAHKPAQFHTDRRLLQSTDTNEQATCESYEFKHMFGKKSVNLTLQTNKFFNFIFS